MFAWIRFSLLLLGAVVWALVFAFPSSWFPAFGLWGLGLLLVAGLIWNGIGWIEKYRAKSGNCPFVRSVAAMGDDMAFPVLVSVVVGAAMILGAGLMAPILQRLEPILWLGQLASWGSTSASLVFGAWLIADRKLPSKEMRKA